MIGPYYGFVYKITNLTNGRSYIGKKFFHFRRKPRGKTRRQTTESDWQDYFGSNDELLGDVARLGVQHFRREILHLCRSKGETNFREVEEQFLQRVLMDESKWYNSSIHTWKRQNVIKYYAGDRPPPEEGATTAE